MTGVYRIFGSELSPYSVKVRSYFRYKKIPHEWVVRNASSEEEFQRHAKLPLVPLVIAPDGKAFQDSTPILDHFEKMFPEPPIHPKDEALAFLSALVEEYADEWGNKPMFHYRWFYEPDQRSAAERIARSVMGNLEEDQLRLGIEMIKGRMIPRLAFVGSSPETKELIEASFHRQIEILERHLASRAYLLGGRPAMADFGLYAQHYQLASDPTPGGIMRATAPGVLAWTQRMLDPAVEGDFELWDALEPTLMPLLREEIGDVFFPWSVGNAKALEAGEKRFSLGLGGKPFSQDTQKYHARSLAALRRRYAGVQDRSRLDPILGRAGCLDFLKEESAGKSAG